MKMLATKMALVTSVALVAAAGPAATQPSKGKGGPPIVRDAEIEQLLREYTQPILQAAGLAKQNINVVIVNERAFNAFVADGRRIFINAGTLMDANTRPATSPAAICRGCARRWRGRARSRSSRSCSASARWSRPRAAAAPAGAKRAWPRCRRRRP